MSDKYNLVIVSEIVKFPNYFVTKTLLNFMGKIQTVCFKLILGLFMIFISCNKEDKKLPEPNPKNQSEVNLKENVTEKPIINDWNLKENRKDLMAVLSEAHANGLNPMDYQLKNIEKTEAKFEKLDSVQQKQYFKMLSKSFLLYYGHLYNGKLNPKKLYSDWDLDQKGVKTDTLLKYALNNKKIKSVLKDAEPKHDQYQGLKMALAKLNKSHKKDACNIDINDKLFVGSKHPAMKDVKKKLLLLGDIKKADTTAAVYEESLLSGVKKFQERHGIEPNGVIERLTVKALNVPIQKRKEQIIANMERWRWFPRDLGNQYLVINIPEYKLYYYSDGKLAGEHKVIIGSDRRKTPIVTSKLDYMVWNPTWAVPSTILKEDYIPAMIEDKKYLERKRITIYDKNQKPVNPEDWTPEKAYQYKYIQDPGEHNLLGKVKFIFANRHFIYLHDTNNKNLFEQSERDLSSGCIRVENPIQLAVRLSTKLSTHVTRNLDEKAPLITKNFKTDEPTKIHVLYWTAWGNKNQVFFREDIYKLDEALYNELQKPVINGKKGGK